MFQKHKYVSSSPYLGNKMNPYASYILWVRSTWSSVTTIERDNNVDDSRWKLARITLYRARHFRLHHHLEPLSSIYRIAFFSSHSFILCRERDIIQWNCNVGRRRRFENIILMPSSCLPSCLPAVELVKK